ncbi:MAG: heme ABC transporter ATP-binding protein [Myxococcota bacterium]
MLCAQHLGVVRSRRSLLNQVSLTIEPGELVALVGPNGAGKSTLLRALVGDLTPTRGHVMLRGRPIAQWGALELAQVRAVVPQASALNFPFTVEEVVRMGHMPHAKGGASPSQVLSWVLDATGLTPLAHQSYTTLSGGERQRVHLARTLVQLEAPERVAGRFWMLDEPTASLDPAAALEVLALVRRLTGEGAGALVVLHDLNLASLFADRLVVLSQGTIVALGTPEKVLSVELMRDVYGLNAHVVSHPDAGRPMIVPAVDPTVTSTPH